MVDSSLEIPRVLARAFPSGAQLCVALSGGRDSTVLLHALANLRDPARHDVRAIHVHHGLQPEADSWARYCMDLCAVLAVPLTVARVSTPRDSGKGLEAAARDARYAALAQALRPGEWLLTAHHEDDQLETVILHLLRGSGVSGLAGIPANANFAGGLLYRPLLGVASDTIKAYATTHGLAWIDDPMNSDAALDRSYLRARVVPALRTRWPAAARAAARSAALLTEATKLLEELAALDESAVVQEHTMSVRQLRALTPARQRNLVRHLVRQRGWAVPPERRLREGLTQLLDAPPERRPVLRWSGHEIRRFRDRLYLLEVPEWTGLPASNPLPWTGQDAIELGGARGRLRLQPTTGSGLLPKVAAGGLTIRFRGGGESVRAGGDAHHRTLKYLFQTRGVVPWMRGHIPLLYAKGALAAVADLWVADWAAAGPADAGVEVVWERHAAII